MTRLGKRSAWAIGGGCTLALIGFLAFSGRITAQQQRAAGDWPNITGGDAGTRYSAVDQINASNFNTLKVAWEWRGAKDAGVNLGGEINARYVGDGGQPS